MSHVVTIQPRFLDTVAIAAACRRLGLQPPVEGEANLFSAQVKGLLLNLPGWQYPAVIDTRDGSVRFDDYEGRWGDRKHLDLFVQAYAVEKTKLEARRRGYTATEQQLEDGSIRIQIVQAV